MSKYELLYRQLLHEGTCTEEHFFDPGLPEDSDILAIHDSVYVDSLRSLTLDRKAIRKLGFPLSAELVERDMGSQFEGSSTSGLPPNPVVKIGKAVQLRICAS